ncbi:helix-turn-helix domain-containing protein [Pontibacter sp. MBLB2868]|uniref:helix-turn-helix domain-containing protein n=1 Tax=Pontibacter sp. MBLB2868 TaxID=3451555 RepID=UPI003F750DF4
MVERIQQLMEFKGFSSSQFADTIEVPRAVISHIISGRNKPSLDVVLKVIAAFPEISKDWMLLGEGEMLKSLVTNVGSDSPGIIGAPTPDTSVHELQEKVHEPGKIQNTPIENVPSGKDQEGTKTIEQIVVFYSDKTFIAYKP